MSTVAATSRRAPRPWWVGFVCGMATFVDGAATVGVGIALVLYQAASPGAAGLSGNEIGILTAALTLGVAIGSLLGGRLGDRIGRRKVFIATMALIFVGAMTPFVNISFPTMLVGISLLGLGVGADLPVALATISEAASNHNRGKIIVFSNILGGFGIAMSVVLGILFGGAGEFGGHVIFGAFGGVALIVLLLRLTIPESNSWLEAQQERREGIRTIRADKVALGDLMKAPYRRPFATLVIYYSLVGMAVSVAGSFGTYIAYNVAHVPVATYSTVSLIALPLAVLAGVWFMAVADTKFRMAYYIVGSIAVVVSNLIPVFFGFTFVTIISSVFLATFAGAFCYETIMKVWTQESFPTMLRGTAQGVIYAVSRFAAAALNVVTPALLAFNPTGLYLAIAVVSAVGFAIGWWGFRKNARNEFDFEQQADPDQVEPAVA
jgi:MFS transporter, SP family, inositol transporter